MIRQIRATIALDHSEVHHRPRLHLLSNYNNNLAISLKSRAGLTFWPRGYFLGYIFIRFASFYVFRPLFHHFDVISNLHRPLFLRSFLCPSLIKKSVSFTFLYNSKMLDFSRNNLISVFTKRNELAYFIQMNYHAERPLLHVSTFQVVQFDSYEHHRSETKPPTLS